MADENIRECEPVRQWPGKGDWSCYKRHVCADSLERAKFEPLEVDLSDHGDEFVQGFLAGQVNAMEWLANDR